MSSQLALTMLIGSYKIQRYATLSIGERILVHRYQNF